MNILKKFLHELTWTDIPPEVRQRAKMLVLDLLGTGVAATQTPLADIVRDYALENHAQGPGASSARLMYDGRSLSLPGAALVGGMTIDAVDAHDGHRLTKGHVGCAVLPALLALIEAAPRPVDGPEFLRLMVAGYEIGSRAGMALHASVPDYHTSGAWNAVTCAALGAYLLGLDDDGFDHALGIAEYHGPRSQMMRGVDHPTMLKDGSGWGAMAGLSAVLMAQKGFTGAPALTVTGADVAPVWKDLGQRWHTMEQYIKGFPVCRWAQPSVWGALQLRQHYDFNAEDIEAVRAVTFHEGTRLNQDIPTDTEQAQYAITFPIAAALVRGQVGVPEISGTAFDDAALRRLHGKITLEEGERFNRRFPAERWAEVEVRLKDGRVLTSGEVSARGDPETQFTDVEISEKFFWLAGHAAASERLEKLHETTLELDKPGREFSDWLAQIYQPGTR